MWNFGSFLTFGIFCNICHEIWTETDPQFQITVSVFTHLVRLIDNSRFILFSRWLRWRRESWKSLRYGSSQVLGSDDNYKLSCMNLCFNTGFNIIHGCFSWFPFVTEKLPLLEFRLVNTRMPSKRCRTWRSKNISRLSGGMCFFKLRKFSRIH